MKSNIFLTSAMALPVALGLSSCQSSSKLADQAKPNVIYILVDDLGYGDLSVNGQTKFQTPNIDAMASTGMNFTQHYAGCSVSAPSRCSLLTGKHTGHAHVRGNKGDVCADGKEYDTPIPSTEVTLGEVFKTKGYTTACIGKWGLGGIQTQGHPNNQGFDYFYGYLGQGYAHSFFPDFLHENSTEIILDKKHYSHDLVENKAVEFIKENKEKPFFLYLTFTLPHAELCLPEKYLNEFKGKFEEEKPFINKGGSYGTQMYPRAAFASMVSRLDRSVGTINGLLEVLGIDDNTLVIFSSDNGAHKEGGADPDFFQSSGIYRGTKRDLHEGGIHIPMIAKFPGKIAAGTTSDHVSAFWDVMPTFCEMINADVPQGVDGVSFLPTLLGKKQEKQADYLYWEFHEQGGRQAVRQGDWKLIKQQVRNKKKTYYQLYNLKEDPRETTNVIKENTEIAEKLKEIMKNARTESSIFKMDCN